LKEVNRELKRIHINRCRCNERLKATTEGETPHIHWVKRDSLLVTQKET
jgi:hypothetical protein